MSGPRVVSIAALLVLALVSALPAGPAAALEIDPELAERVYSPARVASDGLVEMVVVLDAPLDLEVIERDLEGLDPEQRRRRAISILKRRAEESQRSVLSSLRAVGPGAEDVRTLWITNAIALRGDQRALQALQASPAKGWVIEDRDITFVEVERPVASAAPSGEAGVSREAVTPNVWSLDWINVPQAWQAGYDGTGVIIGHVDSGVWFDHNDLADRIWYNTGEVPDNGIDDDGNGLVDDWRGWDFADRDNDPTDDAYDFDGGGHGTHTAGTACGDGTNGLRTGVAPGARIIVAKSQRTEDGRGTGSSVWESQQYVLEMGAHVITMSVGAIGNLPPALLQAERRVGDTLRLVRVALFTSAGNAHGGIDPRYELTGIARVPAPWHENQNVPYSSLSGVIAVGATAFQEDTNWQFSSQGPATWGHVRPWSDWDIEAGNALIKPDISAPGMGVSSLLRPNSYSQTNWNGTSMACPHAAGVAALMLSKNPTLTPADLARILMTTSVDLGAPGKDNVFGAGRIDAAAALAAVPVQQVASVVVSDATIVDANGNGYLETGEEFALSIELFNNNLIDADGLRIETSVTGGGEFVSVQNGSVMAGTVPAGETRTPDTDPTFVVSSLARQGDPFEITVSLRTSDAYQEQFNFPFRVGRPDIVEQSAGVLNLSVTDHGTLGWHDLDQLEGTGCNATGLENLLYIGGFWGGTGTDYVADRDYTLVTSGDWRVSTSPNGAIEEPARKRSDQDLIAIFNDANHPEPRGVQVIQRSMVWHGEDTEDFIVLEYEIVNTGLTFLRDYHAALFCDWDLYYYDYNVAGTDPGRNLAWMSERYVTQEHVGMMVLGDQPASNVSVVNNSVHVHPYLDLPDPSKYRFMTGEYHRANAPDDGEWSVVVAAGPWDIPAGGRVKVAFAIVHGSDLADLQANADMANAVYAATPVDTGPAPASYRNLLAQNFPNPFNPSTSIEFEIAEAGEVFLAVYDLAGRRVRTLAHRRFDGGQHAVNWDGSDDAGSPVASGTYLYRMTAGGETRTRKMTLLK